MKQALSCLQARFIKDIQSVYTNRLIFGATHWRLTIGEVYIRLKTYDIVWLV